MVDTHQAETALWTERREWSDSIEAKLESRRRKLGVQDEVKDIWGVNTLMLVELGEKGVRSVEDLADCATDDLYGWSEYTGGKTVRHAGIFDRVGVTRQQCEEIIIRARVKAGWIE